MLVYDGKQHFEAHPSALHSKVNALDAQWERSAPHATTPSRKLMYNRACALGLLVGINGFTYFLINAILAS